MKRFLSIMSMVALLLATHSLFAADQPKRDEATGLIIDMGFELVKANCTACHSAALVIQNRMSHDGWLESIRWMQRTQELWPLPQEPIMLDYLTKHYGPTESGRRNNLADHLMPPKAL